jgi:hypothetical protein
LEVREKLNNRIQVTLAILVTFFSITAYMARMFDLNSNILISAVFSLSLTVACICIVPAIIYAINAIKRNLYKGLPSAQEIEKFRKETEDYELEIKKYNETADKFHKVDDDFSSSVEMKGFLCDYFVKWSSYNTEVNDYRSKSIQESTDWIIRAAWPLIVSCILFIGFDLDTSSPRKNLLIGDVNVSNAIEKLTHSIQNSGNAYSVKTISGENGTPQ